MNNSNEKSIFNGFCSTLYKKCQSKITLNTEFCLHIAQKSIYNLFVFLKYLENRKNTLIFKMIYNSIFYFYLNHFK